MKSSQSLVGKKPIKTLQEILGEKFMPNGWGKPQPKKGN
jgi:hypothetical protein